MKKNTTFRTVDIFILTAIAIQFIAFLLNYEVNLLITLISALQFVFLVSYLYFMIRLRQYFETTINEENRFFDKQFEEIKFNLNQKKIIIGKYLNRQKTVESIRKMFNHTRMIYTEKIKTEDNNQLTIELLLITEHGVFIVEFHDARFILRGDYQQDMMQIQYAHHQTIEVINPLSNVHPLIQYIKKTLAISDMDIKRLMVVQNNSYVGGMQTLGINQAISKVDDIQEKMNQLINQSKTKLTLKQIKAYDQILSDKIIG